MLTPLPSYFDIEWEGPQLNSQGKPDGAPKRELSPISIPSLVANIASLHRLTIPMTR